MTSFPLTPSRVLMVDMNKVEKVAIFGSAFVEEQDPLYQQVFQTSKLLAQSGFVVAQGGGAGLMCAAGKGAKAGGGQTIGVTFYPTETDGVHPKCYWARSSRCR